MKLSQKQAKFTKYIAMLIQWGAANGYDLTIGEAYRSKETQDAHVAAGRSFAPNSRHLLRLAVDFNLFIDGKYQQKSEAYEPLGEFWKSLDPKNRWGGDWEGLKDGNHFEYAG